MTGQLDGFITFEFAVLALQELSLSWGRVAGGREEEKERKKDVVVCCELHVDRLEQIEDDLKGGRYLDRAP